MKTIKFQHMKEFATESGFTITMKALITIRRPELHTQFVECYEDKNRYPAESLREVKTVKQPGIFPGFSPLPVSVFSPAPPQI